MTKQNRYEDDDGFDENGILKTGRSTRAKRVCIQVRHFGAQSQQPVIQTGIGDVIGRRRRQGNCRRRGQNRANLRRRRRP